MSFLRIDNIKNPAIAGFFLCRIFLAVVLLTSASPSLAVPQSYSALYQVEADGMSLGKLERTLKQSADGSYILKTKTYVTGFWAIFIKDRVNEESCFAMVDNKVIPKSYHYTKKKKGKFIKESVIFDYDKATILSSSGSGKQSFPLIGNESDKLIYQFRIREALRRGESELQFSVVDRMRLRSYQFKVGSLEVLDTPMGKIEAVRVDRINEEKRKTTLWFAPGLGYLPVKIVQDAGDHIFSSTIFSTSIQRQK